MTSQPNRKGGRHVAKKEPNYRLRMIIMIILAVVMVLAAVVCILIRTWVVKPELPPIVESTPPGPVQSHAPHSSQDPAVSPTPDLPDYDPVQPKASGERKSQDFYTILVFGTDETSGLTDTMMVVSYDVTNQKAAAISLPRDTLINVKSSYKKLNGVYSRYGGGQSGITALKNEVSELIGFMPDYYVQVNWELVGQMVDAIGGVYFDVPCHMGYDDPYQDLHIHFEAGYQYLAGEDAMNLVRWRHNNDGTPTEGGGSDISRLQIQQNFLKAVLQQTLQLKNVTKISQLAKLFGENVVSDLAIENLFWFGSQAIMGGLDVDSVQFCTMPFRYGTDYNGYSYVCPKRNELLTIINDQLNPYVENVTMKQLDLMEVRSDGTLASSTGVLADPSMAVLPVPETPEPSDDPNPDESRNPIVDQPPGGSGSDDPQPSATPGVNTDPVTTPEPTPAPTTDPEPEPSDDGGGLEWPVGGGIWDNPI